MSKYDHIWLKWMEGELSSAEEELLKGDPDYAELVKSLEAASRLPVPAFDKQKVWNAIQAAKTKPTTHTVIPARRARRIPLRIMVAAASVALLAIFFFLRNPYTSITADAGEQIAYVLPDGSQVQLNAGSNLRFRKKNWEENRQVKLLGEAFFKVDVPGPFRVVTPQSEVAVLGTSFNVKDWNEQVEVACFTGKVSVTYLPDAKETSLAGGEAIRYAAGIEQDKTLSGSASNPSWLNGQSTYQAVPLAEVLADLERQYNLRIISSGVDNARIFSGGFIHNDVDLALEMVLEPMQISWRKTGNSVVLQQQ